MFSKLTLSCAGSLLGISVMASAAIPIIVKVAVNKEAAAYYQSVLKQTQKQAVELSPNDIKNTRRGFISLVMFIQALDKVGLAAKFEFVISPNAKRSVALVQSGAALFTTRTLVHGYTPKNTLKSSALIGSGGLLRGIFGLKSNHALMKVKTLDELKRFSAVTNVSWQTEIKFLNDIGIKKIQLSHSRQSIFKHIAYNNIDFVLLAITRNNRYKLQYAGITLLPITGLVIQPKSSYHYLISKKHPDSQRVYQALEKGLSIMREQGLIKEHYRRIIFFLDDFPQWKILNQADADENEG